MLRRFGIFVSEPLHQFQDREPLRGVVEQGRKGGTSAVTSDRATFIGAWNASFCTEQRDQGVVQVVFTDRLPTMNEEVIDFFSCLAITVMGMAYCTDLFPFDNPLTHDGIDRLLKGCCRFVDRDGEEAYCLFREKFTRLWYTDVFSLPTNTPKTKTGDLVGAQPGVDPNSGNGANHCKRILNHSMRAVRKVFFGEVECCMYDLRPDERTEVARIGTDLVGNGTRSAKGARRVKSPWKMV